ncbi:MULTISPECIES: Uma2 family endonuclease [unclassified Moorena]|uniref:Uma2 family endonuclease n=1 Tax=unclassified Moorena TaxID=2683338 RepID=UPI0014001491|nr:MULTISPECIES: Uma2 family endonuclease [unclassified Moorena]NEO13830.1 Uma2 family endonuclease [Moorena sp. SIO3E8]NEQ00722.1 Uma2 family endonuclease [Moorena sp. SIO3F7]
MTVATTAVETNPIVLRMPPALDMDDDQFFEFCQVNRDLRIERTLDGEIIVMPPTGGETSDRNSDINFQLRLWNRQTKLGKVFESSCGFKLPNGADRSPDASWLKLERWESLSKEQRKKFIPLCPDFVIELRSPSDRVKDLKDKMEEYMDNGARLGWLIEPNSRRVYIYRPGADVEQLENPATVKGDDSVLPGFVMVMEEIWEG